MNLREFAYNWKNPNYTPEQYHLSNLLSAIRVDIDGGKWEGNIWVENDIALEWKQSEVHFAHTYYGTIYIRNLNTGKNETFVITYQLTDNYQMLATNVHFEEFAKRLRYVMKEEYLPIEPT